MPNILAAGATALLSLMSTGTASGVLLAEGECEVLQSEVTWGFKESFRSYISGAIALGQWSTSGDVGYETPTFIFSGGDGAIAADRRSGDVAFDGELLFEGHGGILSTSLSDPSIVFEGPREAVLVVDVTGDTMDMVSVSAQDVEFVTLSWSAGDEQVDPETGQWRIMGAETTLTAAGSEAFGTYVAGEIFDPMTITLQVTPSCLTETPLNPWWFAGGVGAVALAGGAVVWAIARGRKSPEPERQ